MDADSVAELRILQASLSLSDARDIAGLRMAVGVSGTRSIGTSSLRGDGAGTGGTWGRT